MRRMSGYPHWFYTVLLLALLALLVTGILLIPTMLTMRLEWDLAWELSADARLLSVALHSALGFLVLALVGALFSIHMRMGWRRRTNLISGFALVFVLVTMWLTAVGIYYFGDEDFSRWASIVHVLAALAALLIFVWHHVTGDRYRHRREQQ